MGTRRAVVVWVKKMGRASIIIAPHWRVDQFVFMDVRMVWNARQVAWNEGSCVAWKEGRRVAWNEGSMGLGSAGGIQLHNVSCVLVTVLTTLGLYLSIDHLLLPCKPPRCPKGATIHLQTHSLLLLGRVWLMPPVTALPTANTGGEHPPESS